MPAFSLTCRVLTRSRPWSGITASWGLSASPCWRTAVISSIFLRWRSCIVDW
ncbi:hypothetical protein CMUS01_13484 [Colletotrichum musicola]|uniref:Uncharacterized protein n=1 Tax=Colletotrichum musicola TaxID=2175873 RepID=A0A8H6JD13_9PEZI|nr:hypothetical protein CMUS01_13484 [Colletotrichum musicola]